MRDPRPSVADTLQISLKTAFRRLSPTKTSDVVFTGSDDLTVELYAPSGRDDQRPHDRDELYFVACGRGTFRRGPDVVDFGPGDLLFAPARADHRFETFTADFKTWVVFFGPWQDGDYSDA